ncbi:hypothetical protein AWC05_12470 [Mycobacterium florentinum]|uniref:Uncharacterized protein n=1 Tax=Mycobacterium florentinum TaxID=292462 RepID=A0A1X1UGI6_MYCFL|nr:hypothetical protein [Mycobacterium florentinum]MCV7412884.1 hypothetical protein [Mycobacterium florentinum]ORV55965.1 hypothetical protein AWC05_12470 [Mycobacterium florentinum]
MIKNRAVRQAGITENTTVEHLVEIFTAANAHGFAVFLSPHYFYPTDHNWLSMVGSNQMNWPATALAAWAH